MSSIFIPPHRQKLAPTATLSEILASERERILTGLLRAVIVLGFLTLIIITPASIQENLWLLLIIYSTALGVTSLVTLNRQLSYEVRAGTFLILFYGLGLIDLVSFGLAEDGRIYLFGFSLAAALLLGTRAGAGALLLSVVTIGFVGGLISTGQFNTFYASHIPSDNFT
ncbi:MAG: hypothetical protein KDF65_12910, partial [Anaerolineae bacterium]|nr:hypothetical protein [Anaerolineae bacterium]